MHIHSNRREEGAEKFDDVEALLVPCRNAGGGGGGRLNGILNKTVIELR